MIISADLNPSCKYCHGQHKSKHCPDKYNIKKLRNAQYGKAVQEREVPNGG